MGARSAHSVAGRPDRETERVSARVSVLMGVRDTPWLRGALESLRWQTYRDFEVIIVDDESDDITLLCLEEAQVALAATGLGVVIIHNRISEGLTRALIDAAMAASGEFLARLDADDTAWPERLARQVAFLDRHPEVGVLGTWGAMMDEQGRPLGAFRPPAAHERIVEERSYSGENGQDSAVLRVGHQEAAVRA